MIRGLVFVIDRNLISLEGVDIFNALNWLPLSEMVFAEALVSEFSDLNKPGKFYGVRQTQSQNSLRMPKVFMISPLLVEVFCLVLSLRSHYSGFE